MNKYQGTYLVAVSGGPDSMALLDMLKTSKTSIIVAHVNYHKRNTALRDETIVKDYCEKNHITFKVADYNASLRGNFQDKARVFRYSFFKQLVEEYKLDGVFVAHHFDDLLETYKLQLNRGSTPSYYGLKEENEILGVKIIRPLLSYSKSDLENYCIEHNIIYGIDESNNSDVYKRNYYRHHVLNELNNQDKLKLKEEIDLKNKELLDKEAKAFSLIKGRTKFTLEEFESFSDKETVLRLLLKKDLSNDYLNDIINQIKNSKKLKIIVDNKYLVKEYGYLEIFEAIEEYNDVYTEIAYLKKPYYELTNEGSSFEGVTLLPDDFPITIRNYHKGDEIKMLYGTKKISRFFIDKKISLKERISWPVVLNKNNEIILVPGIGCNVSHYSIKHNLFVLKSKDKGGI